MKFQIFGSKSSTDVDMVVFVAAIPSMKAAADLCFTYKNELQKKYAFDRPLNINIACLENGMISKVHKGTVDELNNALWYTFDLHPQFFPQQITKLMERNIDIKMIRSARKILSFLSRTPERVAVKKALQGDFKDKINRLSQIELALFSDFGRKGSLIDFKKMIAFQLGQTIPLMQGIELYTKEAIGAHYPSIQGHLMRLENTSMEALQLLLNEFTELSNLRIPLMNQLVE